ncbi:MAG TPA: RagB/SusD family nutrient uptake outer membrane protein [Pedobacter sp.]|nr:RagB/SusD family nutrient uptake outer membrane protein [Pedobacter sp.]
MRNRIYASLLTLIVIVSCASCKKWLDVQPSTKIKSDVLFETEQGYKDALLGCYAIMKTEPLYGRELTFGFMDAAAAQYDLFNNATYRDLSTFNFTYKTTLLRPKVDNIWSSMYNVIANANNILDHIDQDKALFTGTNYQIIKGEALAIRAYVHLDLMRLFASTDLTKVAIPYMRSLTTEVNPRLTGNEVMKLLLQDLQDAATNLSIDPIKNGAKRSTSEFMNNRHQRLNYFAVKGLAARAYLWQGDKVNALANAMEVMSSGNQIFPWIQTSNIAASLEKDRDYTFSTENLFALNVFDLKAIGNTWVFAALPANQLQKSSSAYNTMFQTTVAGVGANDIRYLYTTKALGTNFIVNKFYQPDNYNPAYATMIPLLRRSEMNYIAAECNIGVNNQAAIDLLNEVRTNRGIVTPLANTLTAAQIQAEILIEFRKEFQGEGQLFAYCKRTKAARFPNNSTNLTDTQLILPLPDVEIEFGR